MRAILLAAGRGTRLMPLTSNTPKCLMPIKGRPLLELWLEKLFEVGVDSVLVNTHYLSQQVEQFVSQNVYNNKIHCVYEPFLLGTAGTLKQHINFFEEEDGFLIHADNYFDGTLFPMVEAHRQRPVGTLLTMLTFRTDKPSECGIVEVDKNNIMYKFHEKVINPPGNIANGALYLISTDLLKTYKESYADAQDFSTDVIPQLASKVFCFETTNTYIDIGTVDNYLKVK